MTNGNTGTNADTTVMTGASKPNVSFNVDNQRQFQSIDGVVPTKGKKVKMPGSVPGSHDVNLNFGMNHNSEYNSSNVFGTVNHQKQSSRTNFIT